MKHGEGQGESRGERCGTPEDPALAALRQAAKGLTYTSEADSALEPFLWEGGGRMSRKRLLELAGAEPGAGVEEFTLDDFLRAVPEEDKAAFDKLAGVIGEQLAGVKVYKVGDEAEKQAFVVGKTGGGDRAGLKATVVET